MYSKVTATALALATFSSATEAEWGRSSSYYAPSYYSAPTYYDYGRSYSFNGPSYYSKPAPVKQVISHQPLKPLSTVTSKTFDLGSHDARSALSQSGITLEVGQKATLVLSSNPTTGYTWQTNKELAGDKCTIEEGYKSDPNPRGYVGSGGRATITITAKKAGEVKLQAANVRPWMFKSWDESFGDVPESMKLELTITIKGKEVTEAPKEVE